jgi:hypothetical protein
MRIAAHLPLLLVLAAACGGVDPAQDGKPASPLEGAPFGYSAGEAFCESPATDSIRVLCKALSAAAPNNEPVMIMGAWREEGGYCVMSTPAKAGLAETFYVVHVADDGRRRWDSPICEEPPEEDGEMGDAEFEEVEAPCASAETDSARVVCVAMRGADLIGMKAKVVKMRRQKDGGHCVAIAPVDPRPENRPAVVHVTFDGEIGVIDRSEGAACDDARPGKEPGAR